MHRSCDGVRSMAVGTAKNHTGSGLRLPLDRPRVRYSIITCDVDGSEAEIGLADWYAMCRNATRDTASIEVGGGCRPAYDALRSCFASAFKRSLSQIGASVVGPTPLLQTCPSRAR